MSSMMLSSVQIQLLRACKGSWLTAYSIFSRAQSIHEINPGEGNGWQLLLSSSSVASLFVSLDLTG